MKLPYEIRFQGVVWQVNAVEVNGRMRLSIWPFRIDRDGSLKANKGGLQVAPEHSEGIIEAILAAAAQLR